MNYQEFIQTAEQLRKNVEELYVYGAGMYGKEIAGLLIRNGIKVDGFVVTKQEEHSDITGLPVRYAGDVIHRQAVGFVLGVNDLYKKEITNYLLKQEIDFSKVIDGGKYITQLKEASHLRDTPVLEINTVLGCGVNCRFCPQEIMTKEYYEKNKKRRRIMRLEDFKFFLGQLPDDCDVVFAGMAEPFLNPDCTEMLKLACSMGRKVFLYTTLEGMKQEDLEEILKLPFWFVGLHVADEKNYAHITVSEAYYRNIERMVKAVKPNGEPFIDDISAQAAPLSRIAEICKGKYEVLVSLHDRCGQLDGDEISHRDHTLTDEEITCAFCGPDMNNHVVLPDGTLLLCNMDYGMQHVLGNLFDNTFDELHRGEEMRHIMRAAKGDQSIDLLCRKCVCAVPKK